MTIIQLSISLNICAFGVDNNSFNVDCTSCPTVDLTSLDGIPGYPRVDLLNLCSAADTASLLIYNPAECAITDIELEIDFDNGLFYGGFVFVDPNSPSNSVVQVANLSNISKPVFSIDQLGAGESTIIDFALKADCNIDFRSEAPINFDASLSFDYTGSTNSGICTRTVTEIGAYNSGVKVPVLNVLTVSPQQVSIPLANSFRCQNITISQDGIGAFLDAFQFTVSGLDTMAYKVTRMAINGITVPATDYAYNAGTQTLSTVINGTYFPNNSHTGANGDALFDSDERLTVQICYEVTGCTDDGNFLTFEAFYGCNDQICGDISSKEGTVIFTPNFGANPQAVDVNLIQEGTVCGQPLIYEGTVRSSNTDPVNGLWQDVILKYDVCGSGNVAPQEPIVNGVALPPGIFSVEDGVVVLDFTANTTDFDGPGGITSEDGDGLFNDLPGGNEISIHETINFECGQIETCAGLSCSMSGFEINGKRNCGQDFQAFANYTPITYDYGTSVAMSNDTLQRSNGALVTVIDWQVPSCTEWNTIPNGYWLYYEYGYENIQPCQNITDVYAEVIFSVNVGSPANGLADLFNYIRYEENTATYNGSPVSGVTSEPITVVVSDGNGGTKLDTIAMRVLIPAGDVNAATHEYYMDLEFLGRCNRYLSSLTYTYKVIEVCGDCSPGGCEITRACEGGQSYFWWPNCCSEPCIWRSNFDTIQRLTYGYADAELTIPKDPATIPPEDLHRFLPGDKALVRTAHEIIDIDLLREQDYYWDFTLREDIGRSRERPLIMDSENAKFLAWYHYDSATGTRTEIGIPDCYQQYPDATREHVFLPTIRTYGTGPGGYDWAGDKYNATLYDEDSYRVCVDAPEINPNYPPESAFDYLRGIAHGDDSLDGYMTFTAYGSRPERCPDTGKGYFRTYYEAPFNTTDPWTDTDQWHNNNCLPD